MIVVDASVIVGALVGVEQASILARIGAEELVAPDILDVETLSALRGLWLRRTLTDAQLHTAVDDLIQLEVDRRPTTVLVPAILLHRFNLTAYDASYVALAEALDCPLITLDARMGNAPGIRCAVEILS
ncbi:type II toxin-antitoxin system VapC family toxin [Microbacterium sp. P07]|uniref:type II toxin-antitoxin system VapC family toxin n=1 Tax=Microbacterium sp. P07 TaxID=3366952 RepID=UPI00374557D6